MSVSRFKDQAVAPRRLNGRPDQLVRDPGVAVGIAGALAFTVSIRTGGIGMRVGMGAGRTCAADDSAGRRGTAGSGHGIWLERPLPRAPCKERCSGLAPNDPITFISIASLMTVIRTLARWIPALRASAIDLTITMGA